MLENFDICASPSPSDNKSIDLGEGDSKNLIVAISAINMPIAAATSVVT
jgi:hypothetical protein